MSQYDILLAMKLASLTTEQIIKELKTDAKGLSVVEAEKRLKEYGENALPTKPRRGPFYLLISQFKSPLVYILLIAAIVSGLTGEIADAGIILFVLLINAGVGYYQEAKAENTLYRLKQILPQEALVRRDGNIKKLEAHLLVPGDVILLKAGEKVVADVKVLSSVDLSVDEAFLTGESRPVKKGALSRKTKHSDDTTSLVYAGSIIQYGEGEGVVVSTGQQTRLGSIASLVKEAGDPETPLQQRIRNLANKLVLVLVSLTVIIFILGVLTGHSYFEMFEIAIALAVSAIPEGLLIAITVILAIGMQRILSQRALVKQLLAAETLGSTSVICTDKTGTLTEGSMKVTKLVTLTDEYTIKQAREMKGRALQRMIDIAVYCNDGVIENYNLAKEKWRLIGRPTDRSLLQLAIDLSVKISAKNRALPRVSYIPFDSKIKYMATVNKVDKFSSIMFVKGAPEKLIERSQHVLKEDREIKLSPTMEKKLMKQAVQLSISGNRVLAAAYKKQPKDGVTISSDDVTGLTFVGFYIIEDPLRPEAANTIKEAKRAGITTVMITGDHPRTALSIAKQLDLPSGDDNILSGDELSEMTDKELMKRITQISVYARVAPEDKMRIVNAWQESGHVVAMTGDGINDAPALKKANIGIAVGSGTEVAKEAADLILLDDNFKTIVAAVAEGRVIFANVIKATRIILSGAFAGIILITTSLLIGIPLPVLAVQILWKNVLTDGMPDIALSAEPAEKNILDLKPNRQGTAILDFQDKFFIVLLSVLMATAGMLSFLFTFDGPETLDRARTIAFSVMVFTSLFTVYSIRDLQHPIWKRSPLDNKFLFYATLAGVALQLLVIYVPLLQKLFATVPLSFNNWGLIIGSSLGIMIILEVFKLSVPKLAKS